MFWLLQLFHSLFLLFVLLLLYSCKHICSDNMRKCVLCVIENGFGWAFYPRHNSVLLHFFFFFSLTLTWFLPPSTSSPLFLFLFSILDGLAFLLASLNPCAQICVNHYMYFFSSCIHFPRLKKQKHSYLIYIFVCLFFWQSFNLLLFVLLAFSVLFCKLRLEQLR